MGRRINPRLTYSEYVSPHAEESTAVEMARRDLMDAIRRVYRPMLEQLRRNVFPAYKELAQSGFDFATPGYRELTRASFGGDGISIDPNGILYHPSVSPYTSLSEGLLKSKLLAWAKKFHAEQDWFLDEILRTLRGWYVTPGWRRSLRTNPIGTSITLLPAGEPLPIYGFWDPQSLAWVDYCRKAREEFEKELSKQEAAGRQRAESHGLVLAPRQYSLIHLDWFVKYQFKGLSSTKIANLDPTEDSSDKTPDESTILKGVHRAAYQLGWSRLRSVPRGRPKTVTKPRKSRT
jgi:hypothetical protein